LMKMRGMRERGVEMEKMEYESKALE